MPKPLPNPQNRIDFADDARSSAKFASSNADLATGSPARDLQYRLAESLTAPRPEAKTLGQKIGFIFLASSLCWATIGLVVSRFLMS